MKKVYYDIQTEEYYNEDQISAFWAQTEQFDYPDYELWLAEATGPNGILSEFTPRDFYDAITDFATEFKQLAWNDEENVAAFRELVDMAIAFGKIPEANRNEPSTWGRLQAAVVYYDNRLRFCYEED